MRFRYKDGSGCREGYPKKSLDYENRIFLEGMLVYLEDVIPVDNEAHALKLLAELSGWYSVTPKRFNKGLY